MKKYTTSKNNNTQQKDSWIEELELRESANLSHKKIKSVRKKYNKKWIQINEASIHNFICYMNIKKSSEDIFEKMITVKTAVTSLHVD